MKKIAKLIVFLILLLNLSSGYVFSQEIQPQSAELTEKMNQIKFNKCLDQDSKSEIQNLFRLHNEYASTHQFDKLKELYAESYVNNDGFDKDTYFDMIKKTWELYPSVVYGTTLKDLGISGDYAIAEVQETASGETKEVLETTNDYGKIDSFSRTYFTLQKIGNTWKLTSADVICEVTSLKYGNAKKLNMDLSAPTSIKNNQEYTISLNMEIPSSSIIIASLNNESIVYPQKHPKEVFRNIKYPGILERVVRANNENCNEYAVASVGITKAALSKNQDSDNVSLNVSGMAFIMSRVNVIDKKPGNISSTVDSQTKAKK